MSNNTETTVKTREQLKQTFVTGAVPTQQDFADVFDAFVHKDDEHVTPTPTPSDEITSFEQFLIAYYPTYKSQENVSWQEFNLKRLPLPVNGSIPSYDPTKNFFERFILYHRGKFYDNNQAGKLLHAFAHLPATPTTAAINDTLEVWLDSLHFYFFFNPDEYAEESDYNYRITGNRTIVKDGYSFTFTVNEAQFETIVEIAGSRDSIGVHALSAQFPSFDGTLYGDIEGTIPPEYGTDDANGFYVANPSLAYGGQPYFKLTEVLNPTSAEIGYYQFECYYCSESELEPGTYYTPDTDMSDGGIDTWLHEVVIPEPAE